MKHHLARVLFAIFNNDANAITLRQEVTPLVLETLVLLEPKTDSTQQVALRFSARYRDQPRYQHPLARFVLQKISFSFSLGVTEMSLLWVVLGLLEVVLQMMSCLRCFLLLLTEFKQ